MQAIEHIRYYAGFADKIHGKTIPCNGKMMAYTYREPLGEFRWLAARGLRIHVKILSAKLFFSGQANS